MKNAATTVAPDQIPETYAALVALHTPRPIHDKIEYDNSVSVIDSLAGFDLNKDQDDYLQVLSGLVESYEDEHVKPLPAVTGSELLQFLIESNDETGDDLSKVLGVDRSTAYKILRGSRKLTAEHIKKLAARYRVSADAFLG